MGAPLATVASTSSYTSNALSTATAAPRHGGRYTGIDLAEASTSKGTATLERPQVTPGPPALADLSSASAASTSGRSFNHMTPEYKAYLRRLTDQYLSQHPEHVDSPEIVSRMVLARSKGFVLSYDDLMRSQVRGGGACQHVTHEYAACEVCWGAAGMGKGIHVHA